jgi:hypothetical protein
MSVESDQLTLLSVEPPARTSASQDFERALLASADTSRLSLYALLNDFAPSGWSGRMCPAFCQSTTEKRLEPSSGSWGNAGMGPHTAFLTLNTPEYHSAAVACSLSDILEIGGVPQRYYLSAIACRGILRRAEKRGKALPEPLKLALERAAHQTEPKKQTA